MWRSKAVRQVTNGDTYEHSIDWSPRGDEIAFVSDRSPETDQFFNYDLFALKVSDGSIRRITATENAEYDPKWSPDGKMIAFRATKRGLTDRETTMEDTHVWVVNADGSGRREFATIDNRQGMPVWSGDGRAIYFTVQERGSVHLYRQAIDGAKAEKVVDGRWHRSARRRWQSRARWLTRFRRRAIWRNFMCAAQAPGAAGETNYKSEFGRFGGKADR